MKKLREVFTEAAPKVIGPYSQAVLYGPFMFLSGQIALEPNTGELIGSSVRDQTERIFENIAAILKEENMGFENVLKTTVYLKSMVDFSQMNEVYAKYFSKPYPARSTVEVSALPKGALVEIEVLAARIIHESEKLF